MKEFTLCSDTNPELEGQGQERESRGHSNVVEHVSVGRKLLKSLKFRNYYTLDRDTTRHLHYNMAFEQNIASPVRYEGQKQQLII